MYTPGSSGPASAGRHSGTYFITFPATYVGGCTSCKHDILTVIYILI